MIKIAIVEDDISYSDQLKEYLHRYHNEYSENFDIHTYSDGDAIVENHHSQYDIILMDVEMRFMDGMTAAEEIRAKDKEVVIIFITNMLPLKRSLKTMISLDQENYLLKRMKK